MSIFYRLINQKALLNLVKIAILALFILGNLLNLQAGWADNGDYDRLSRWVSSGPSQIENWPYDNPETWKLRFVNYWIPEWKLDYPNGSNMFISAMLLWAPGILINRYLYSASTLSLPIMSIGPRLALLIFLLLVFKWIDAHSKHPPLHYLALAFPLALLFSTTDVVAFFNTFYQETGTIVFVPFLLAVVILGYFVPRNFKYYSLYLVAMTLVTTSKSASFYWPIITLPFVLPISQIMKKPALYLPVGLILLLVPFGLGLTLTRVPDVYNAPNREYNSLFTGALLLSNDPQARLQELGIPQAVTCVGVDFYTPAGTECAQKYKPSISYQAVLQSMVSEPAIVVRQLSLLADSVQNYSLDLGKYAYGDTIKRQETRLNLWSVVKSRYFPRGWGLAASMAVFMLAIFFTWRRKDFLAPLSRVALLLLLAFWADLIVEIWGDGQRDLLKHLFLPNMFFDYLLIAAINILLVLGFERFTAWRSQKASS
jgi:hypothetical protein